MTKSRSKSSKRWLERQRKDDYVQKAQSEGYRSRAVYKLLEINSKYNLLQRGTVCVDLGAAPGGWSQVAVHLVGKGNVFALDILPIDPIDGVDILIGDFREEPVQEELHKRLNNRAVDLVISDMAPNFSGMADVDVLRGLTLAEIALEFAIRVLKPKGNFLVKLFQGQGFENYKADLKQYFSKVLVCKPKASRKESREVYLLGIGYNEVSLE